MLRGRGLGTRHIFERGEGRHDYEFFLLGGGGMREQFSFRKIAER